MPGSNQETIENCLARLADAETVLADVRKLLKQAAQNDISYTSDGSSAKGAVAAVPAAVPPAPVAPAAQPAAVAPLAAVKKDISQNSFPEQKDPKKVTPIEKAVAGDSKVDPMMTSTASSVITTSPSKKGDIDDSEFNPGDHGDIVDHIAEAKKQVPALAEKHNLSEEKVERIFEIFSRANHSRTGLLAITELEQLLSDMCDGTIEPHQLNYIMEKFDQDKDGQLHFNEFIDAFVNTPLMKVAHLNDDLKSKGGGARSAIQEAGIRLQAEDWVQIMGCKAVSAKRYVAKEISEAGACMAMPLVFLMFACFYWTIWNHLDYEKVHAVDQAIYFDITENANFAFGGDMPLENGRMGHKNIFDVNSIGDFWSWVELGITPIFWAEGWDLSETRLNILTRCQPALTSLKGYGWDASTVTGVAKALDSSATPPTACPADPDPPTRPTKFYANADKGTYLYYNNVIGGVRMRQERSKTYDCPNDDTTVRDKIHRGECVPDEGYFLQPELHAALRTDMSLVNQPGGETIYLPSLLPQNEVRQRVQKLENEVWLSPYTAKVEVLLTTYNSHLDVFTATYVWIFINRGGHMYKVVQPISTSLTNYRYAICYVLDALLVILCLKIVIEEGSEIFTAMRIKGMKTGLKDYIAPANFVDWLSVFYFFFVMAWWIRHTGIIQDLQESMRKADTLKQGSFENNQDRDRFYEVVDTWVVSDNDLRTVLAIFPFIVGMRFFKVFSLQPRLGVVTATLSKSMRDIAHYMVVFGSIFLVFVVAAMILFGHDLDEFTNFGRAMMSVLLIMIGDYDWDEMIRVGRQHTACWFWSFTWLVNLIMLNMLLAIIMDVYTEVKCGISADAETMWSQVAEIFNRFMEMRRGHQISLEVIYEALEKKFPESEEEQEEEEQRLTVADFMAICPNMPEHQALRILAAAYTNDKDEASTGGSMSETSTRVVHIFKNTQVLHDAVGELMHMNETMSEMINANFAEMRYHGHRSKKDHRESTKKIIDLMSQGGSRQGQEVWVAV